MVPELWAMCMQNRINIFHIIQEIVPVSRFQNSDLGIASSKINGICQHLVLDHVNINICMQNFNKIFQVVQALLPVSLTDTCN